MKYLKSFNETYTELFIPKEFENEMKEYEFKEGENVFVVDFWKRLTHLNVWTRNYGTKLHGPELLKNSNAFSVIKNVTEITIDFINKIKPDCLLINHMTDKSEQGGNFMNKRAKLNYRSLKDKIPADYSINYYKLHDDIPESDVMCVIKHNKFEFDEKYNPIEYAKLIN